MTVEDVRSLLGRLGELADLTERTERQILERALRRLAQLSRTPENAEERATLERIIGRARTHLTSGAADKIL